MSAVRSIRPELVSPMASMPAGLDSCEELAYRKAHARAMSLYVRKHGAPSVTSDKESPAPGTPARVKLAERVREASAAWHAEHGSARDTAAHKAGMSGLRAYWKRHGLTDRAEAYGPVRAPRKPAARKLAPVPDPVPSPVVVIHVDDTPAAPVDAWAPVMPWNRVSYGMSKEHDIPRWSTVATDPTSLDAKCDRVYGPVTESGAMPARYVPDEPAPTFVDVIARRADNKARNRELAAEMRDAGIPITVETWNAAKSGQLAGIGELA